MTTGQAAVFRRPQRITRRDGLRLSAAPEHPERHLPFPPGFVRRPALVRRLVGAEDVSAVVITAPPGYGKSTLLREWQIADQRPFLWVSPSTEKAIRSAIATARACGESSVLVVDDADLAPPGLLRDLLDAAAAELPFGTLLALAARGEPSLPLASLRAHRRLVEVGIRDLAMSTAEATALLSGAEVRLELEDVEALVQRTEGWPAALYLSAAAALGHAELPPATPPIGDSGHLLAAYLREDVLSALPREMVAFATQSSVLDELSGPVCDAVLERRDSASRLSRLARMTNLLTPLDAQHERFRWHGLLRELLAGELRRDAPELRARLHGRAADWYHERGEETAAIDHMVAIGNAEQAGQLLLASLPKLLGGGREQLVARWLASFSAGQIANHPTLAVSAAHSALAAGDVAGAEQWALTARAVPSRGSGAAAEGVTTGLAVIEAMVARAGATKMGRVATRAFETEPTGSAWHPVLFFLRVTSMHLTGDHVAAAELFKMGAALGAVATPSVSSLCLAEHAMVAIERGDWETAADLADRALKTVDQHGLVSCPASALVFAASAAVRAHQRCADEAKRDVRTAAALLADLGDFATWYGALARILLSHASLSLADAVRARTLLAEASRLARRTPDAVIFEHWFEDAWAYLDTLAETSLAGPSALTIAELRILRFLPSHRSFREIATHLGVSANTVKTQAHAIYRKLGVASRSEAVDRAEQAGLLGL